MNDQAIEQEIQAKGKTAPRITPADIEANIASEHYFTAANGVYGAVADDVLRRLGENATLRGIGIVHTGPLYLLTFCVLVLRNGFTVTGESACASPENFDAEIGRKVARDNAIDKVWPLMGYALKQQLHDAASLRPERGADHPGYSTLQPHQQRVVDELNELNQRMTKLEAFAKSEIFRSLDEAERGRLMAQHGAMNAYSNILQERIAAFAPAAT